MRFDIREIGPEHYTVDMASESIWPLLSFDPWKNKANLRRTVETLVQS